MLFKKPAFIGLMFLTMFILISFAGEDTFMYSEKIILNTSSSNEEMKGDIKNLPVLIKLDKSFDFSKVKDKGADIRFTTSEGANLPYTVDKWDEKEAQVWVLVPMVKANNSEQYITFSYGNDAASSQDDETSVFKDVEHDIIGIYENGSFKIVSKTKDKVSNIKERRMK